MNDIVTSGDMAASREVRTGFLSGPGFVDKPVRYSVVDGIALYQGCIDMGPVEEVEAAAARLRPGEPADVGQPPSELLGIGLPSDSDMLWPNGVVPFVIDAGLPNQARVTQAIAHIHDNTGIRFVARGSQANYVRFVRNPNQTWSSSPIGMRGGEQLIRLSDGATMGTTVHECLHSLGILHEQSRCDRDQFVTINYANIQDGFESNFDRFCDGFTDYFDYDYDSIMHYGPTAFGINGATTIVPKRAGVTIGQRNGLSFGDRVTIAHMYARFTGRGHTGVFRAGSGKHALWVNANWDSFKAKWQEWAAEGLRLIDINVRRVGDELRYSGVWTAGTGGYALWANASWDSFKAKWQEWAGQGLRLVDINVHEVGGQARYSGVWLAGSGGYGLWVNASWDSFKAKWQEWAGQGLRLVDLNVHQAGGDNRYSGAWLAGTDAYYLWANVPWESFRARWQQQSANGLRLIDYEFTEPASADALDFTGSPEEAAAPLPSGVGGLFDGETLTDLTDITAGVDGTPTALDGEGGTGGAETGTFTPTAATTGDGVGGVSAGPTPEPVATTAADGDGGLVTDGNQKTVTLTVAGLGGTANGGDHPTKTTRKPKAAKH